MRHRGLGALGIQTGPFKPLLFQTFSTFFTFILGGQFLLPQRANNGKEGFIQHRNTDKLVQGPDHGGGQPGGARPLAHLHFNKNWPPSMKVKKLQKFGNNSCSMGCIWSSLNAQGTEILWYHVILELGDFPFPIVSQQW